MVETDEVEDPRAFDVERDIFVLGKLKQKVAGVCSLVSAAPVVSAAHVGARADALLGPAIPKAIGIQTDGNRRWLRRSGQSAECDQ